MMPTQSSLIHSNGSTVTMFSREVADTMCLNALTALMRAAASLLRGVGTDDHDALDAAYLRADDLAMRCAHALMVEHPHAAETIQNGRMASTIATAQASPAAYAAIKRRQVPSRTYIAFNPLSGLVKIGSSYNPQKRMTELQTGAGALPELLLVIDEDVERRLHKKFKRLHVFGEWFKDDGSIKKFISDMKQAA